jgi:DNA polymerase V
MDLVSRETRTKELSFWVSFDPITLEELPNYNGPVSLDYYGRLHPCHVVGSVRLGAHTSSRKEISAALLYAFDKKVDPRLYIRRLGVVAGNLQAGYVQLDFFTDYKEQEREERLQWVLLEIRQKYTLISGKMIIMIFPVLGAGCWSEAAGAAGAPFWAGLSLFMYRMISPC